MARKKDAVSSPERQDSSEEESLNCCQLKVHQKRIIERQKYRFDPTFNGPLKKRSCTDIICLFFYLATLIIWILLGVFAFVYGNPQELFSPRDSQNRICGYDEGVETKPYLFFFDLTRCAEAFTPQNAFHCNTPQVCVEKCPEENFLANKYLELTWTNQYTEELKEKAICIDGLNKGINSKQDFQNLLKNNTCALWYLSSSPVARRCLPIPDMYKTNQANYTIGDKTYTQDMKPEFIAKLTNSTTFVNAVSSITEFGHAVADDLSKTWPYIVIAMIIAMVVSLIYIIIMRWIAGIMVWVSLIGSVGLLAFCCYTTWIRYDDLRKAAAQPTMKGFIREAGQGDPISDVIKEQTNNLLAMKETWLFFFILSVIALVLVLILILFLRNRIRIAIALINEGSRSVGNSWSTLFFPIFPWIFQILVICYALGICLFLFSAGVPIYRVSGVQNETTCNCPLSDGQICTPEDFSRKCSDCVLAGCFFEKQETQQYMIYLQLINLFIFLWTLFFISALGDIILASVFATWYWTFHKSQVPFFILLQSTGRVLTYHVGTAAFGALILAICRWIRIIIEVFYNMCNKYDNCFIKALKCCLSCFFWCLEKFLRLLNKNAYIMCAVHGKNFCVSAKDAFNLLMRNVIRVVVLDRVTGLLFFLCKLMITAGMGAISFYVFSKPVVDLQSVDEPPYQSEYYFVSIILVCIGTYFIASLFFGVYSMAVDTLFLCFLEDCERNDGSVEKPYFMSKNLMNILGKRNKKPKKKRDD